MSCFNPLMKSLSLKTKLPQRKTNKITMMTFGMTKNPKNSINPRLPKLSKNKKFLSKL